MEKYFLLFFSILFLMLLFENNNEQFSKDREPFSFYKCAEYYNNKTIYNKHKNNMCIDYSLVHPFYYWNI